MPKSAVADCLSRVFKGASVRQSPSVPDDVRGSMLEKGVAIESLSMLLWHKNIVIREKHYAPWIKSRQDELEAAVKKVMEVIENSGLIRFLFASR
jgi:hypothetical protein